MLRHRFLWLVCITLLSLPLSLSAQTTTGTVRGYVKDQNQAAVADAEVSARNTESGVLRSTTTRSDGSYILPGLTPATYEFGIRKIGYSPQQRRFPVQVGATLDVDFTLQAGAVELQAVSVEATEVETRTSEVATNVSQQQVANLPITDRNFLNLSALAPGVTIQNQKLNDTRRTFSAGAQPAEAINVFVDGASYKNDILQGGVAGQDASRGNPFPLNAVREFRVITQNYKAEYQKASSAIIAATTQSGTNDWHGNAFFYGMGEGLQARDPFLLPSAAKPDFKRTLVGASVGGPIIRNRLHVFASYEGNYQDRFAVVSLDTVPADTANLKPYNGSFLQPFRETLLFGKLSYQLTATQSLELSANTRHETDIRDFGGTTSYETANNVKNDVTTATLKHQATWGSGWLNEATVTGQWYYWNPVATNPALIGRNYFGKGRIGGKDTEQRFGQNRISLRNDLTYSGMHGHVIKGGFNADFLDYTVKKLFNANPVFNYSSDTVDGHYAVAYQAPFQAQYGFGNPDLSANNHQIGAYIQDDWSPTSRLILNLGVRWDYESDMLNNDYVTPANIRDSIQSPTFSDSVLFPVDASYFTNGKQRPPFYGAFQPRLGFSYALDNEGKTTLFGGFGVFYDRDFYNSVLDERFRLQYAVLTFRFSSNGLPDRNGLPTIQWNDSYLSKAGLDALVANGTAPRPEAFLINNNTRPPRSNQWNFGVRRMLGRYVASLTYSGVRSYNGLTYIFGNRRTNGNCCYQNPTFPFSNVLLSSDDVRTWYDALYVKIERPYEGGRTWAWGGGLSVTFSKAQAIGGDLFSLDYAHVTDFPKHPTTSDEKYRIVGNWTLEIPFEIQFSGLLTLGSGNPYQTFGTGIQPNTSYAYPPKDNFIIPNAFAFRNVDVKFSKLVQIAGNQRVGLLAEVFNVFNFTNNGCFDGGRQSPNFGTPSCAVTDSRYTQLGAQYTF